MQRIKQPSSVFLRFIYTFHGLYLKIVASLRGRTHLHVSNVIAEKQLGVLALKFSGEHYWVDEKTTF